MSRNTPSKRILVGMGGWDLPPFDGLFYPSSKKRGFRKLEFYSRFFDFVELNGSFYNPSFTPSQVRQWLRDVEANERFVFSVKLFRGFTHERDASGRDVLSVRRLLDQLVSGGRFGGLLLQFPYSFRNTQNNRKHFLNVCTFFREYPRFVEVRHNSWNSPPVVKMFDEAGVIPVNVDLPQIQNHMPLTTLVRNGFSYFRLMGRNRETWEQPWNVDERGTHLVSDRYLYHYSSLELTELGAAIRSTTRTASSVFVVFHNDPQANSLVNGFQMRRLLSPESVLTAPASLLRAFPVLSAVVRPSELPGLPLLQK
jgi:uncharacterized protein YecE (DUF72 family)